MKTIIAEDEVLAVKGLLTLIDQYKDFFEVVAVTRNGKDAVEAVNILQPDLIFLDIEMPVLNGFEVLANLKTMPKIVFTTAYDDYAIKAFEANSVDYLLKPIERERFDITVNRLKQQLIGNLEGTHLQKLTELVQALKAPGDLHALTVKSRDKILFIPLTEITHFISEDRYVKLSTSDGKQYLTNYSIQGLEDKLPKDFIRVSRSTIIDSKKILEVQRFFSGNFVITMKDSKHSKVETGRKYVENLKTLFNGMV